MKKKIAAIAAAVFLSLSGLTAGSVYIYQNYEFVDGSILSHDTIDKINYFGMVRFMQGVQACKAGS